MTNENHVVGNDEQAVRTADVHGRLRMPAADIYETPDAYVVMLDLPGAAKEAVRLRMAKGELHVQASLEDRGVREGTPIFQEMAPATFSRSFTIGEGIDTENIDARFEQGVLTVKLYKSAALKPRDIHVK